MNPSILLAIANSPFFLPRPKMPQPSRFARVDFKIPGFVGGG